MYGLTGLDMSILYILRQSWGDIRGIYVLPHVLVYGLIGLDMTIPSCTGVYRVLFMRMIILVNDKGNAEGIIRCRIRSTCEVTAGEKESRQHCGCLRYQW